jgi:hypothetical protein
VLGDLTAKGVMLAEPALRKEMDRLLAEAEKQIAAEKKA